MIKKSYLFFLTGLLTLAYACEAPNASVAKPEKEINIDEYKASLIGKKMILVDSLTQINRHEFVVREKPLTLVALYVASCNPCLIKMKKWKKLLVQSEDLNKANIVIYAKNSLNWYFDHQVNEVNEFPFPVYHDPADIFARTNDAPELTYIRSVLLDETGTVIFAGNPMDEQEDFNKLFEILKSY
ncbi:MAG: hypothetical protein R8G66_18380 [Cytophagales bacterium]|nr:hypothetical protein [Cytophagales bacterium]